MVCFDGVAKVIVILFVRFSNLKSRISVVDASVNFTRTSEAAEARKAFTLAADALLEVWAPVYCFFSSSLCVGWCQYSSRI